MSHETEKTRHAVDMLVEHFEKFFAVYEDVASYLNLSKGKQDYFSKQMRWIKRLQQAEFPVAVLGSYSSGKSTTVNALVGREILPENAKPTTAVLTVVRKGQRDEAFVHYLDKDAKLELRGQLIHQVATQINDPDLGIDKKETFLADLDRKIAKFEEQSKTQIEREAYQKLCALLKKWDNIPTASKPISLEEIENYVEGNNDALFIDRIEAYVKDIDLPDDVLLVDLPGLGVTNQRHERITEEYIRQGAKAFVVCTNPLKMLQGKEIDLLDKINRENPTILQRSFWVINQMDTLQGERKRENIEDYFKEQEHKHHFAVAPEKKFKVSAQNFFLLTSIVAGNLDLTKYLKKHVANLKVMGVDPEHVKHNPEKAQELLEDNEDVREFARFKQALFTYLNTTAREEFISNAKGELLRMLTDMIEIVDPLQRRYPEGDDLEKRYFSSAVQRAMHDFIGKARRKVSDIVNQMRLGEPSELWDERIQQKVKSAINTALAVDHHELKQALQAGIDVDQNVSRLPAIIEQRLHLTQHLRAMMVEAIQEPFIERFLNRVLIELLEVRKDYFPDDLIRILQERLSERDITMRLYGLADSLLFEYGEKMEDIGLSLKTELNGSQENDARLKSLLDMYRKHLLEFTEGLKTDINRLMWRCLKNHAESLQEEIERLFDEKRDLIHDRIAAQLKLSDTIELEKQRIIILKRSYADLIRLRSEL